MKLLTDSVNSFIAKAPPTAHDALRSELAVLTANYERLCSRLDGKCKTLEVRVELSGLLCDHSFVNVNFKWQGKGLIQMISVGFECVIRGCVQFIIGEVN